MTVLDAFLWLGSTRPGALLRQSTLLFGLTEAAHVTALALVGGSALIVNLSAVGVLLRAIPTRRIWRSVQPIMLLSLASGIVTGVLLVSSGPLKYYTNPVFFIKLALLLAAVVVHFTLYARVTRADADVRGQTVWRVSAGLSLSLWLSVILAGRIIGLI